MLLQLKHTLKMETGAVLKKPSKGMTLGAGGSGAIDSVTRGLAVDLAPIRVNCVCVGLVVTEVSLSFPFEMQLMLTPDGSFSTPRWRKQLRNS